MAQNEGPNRTTCAIVAVIPFLNLFAVQKTHF
jgi:hypothetical protein